MTFDCRASSVELPNSTKGQAMEVPTTKAFGPARIVALALIGLAVLGLAYLHVGTGKNSLSVPSGADAGQSKLHCPEVTSARAHARDFLSEKSFRADATAFKACAHRLQDDGVDLAGYTLPERVDDLDAARHAIGYDRIDLLSESAGTRTAMIYAWRYPKRIHRSVMIG